MPDFLFALGIAIALPLILAWLVDEAWRQFNGRD